MAYSAKTYTGDGTTTDFEITFDYLDRTHIYVAVDKILTTDGSSLYDFIFVNDNTVRVTKIADGSAPVNGAEIVLSRQTPIGTPAVVFGPGAALTKDNMNKNAEYLTFALQEATDKNDAFNKIYLGRKAAAPTVDNDGDPLKAGALYLDSNDEVLYHYDGSSWSAVIDGFLAARDAAQAAQTAAEAAQTAAETAESNAQTHETNASGSAAAAASSANTASTQASNASTSASNAATSESNAATSESNAATSETNALNSANAAATSESNAATSESNAATSEANAATSASDADTAKTAAEAAQAAAETVYDTFDDRFLGVKASAPTLDNDGDPLQTGAIYFNSTDDYWYLWNGSAWVAAAVPDGDYMLKTENLSGLSNYATARSNLGLVIGTNVQAYSANLDSINQNLGTTDNVTHNNITASGTVDINGDYITIGGNIATATLSLSAGTTGTFNSRDVQLQARSGPTANQVSAFIRTPNGDPPTDVAEFRYDNTIHFFGDTYLGTNNLWEVDYIGWGSNSSSDYIRWITTVGLRGHENGTQVWQLGDIYNDTTANAADVSVNVNGVLKRSTSSGAYKINRTSVDGEVVMDLNPVSFESTHLSDWGRRFTGFIAEEVEAAFPEASIHNGTNYDSRAIVAALVAKVQSQQSQIDDLVTRIAALEAGSGEGTSTKGGKA